MNKKLAEFLSKYNFQIDGNSAYGKIKDYEVNFYYDAMNNVSPVKWFVSFYGTVEEKNKITYAIQNQKIKFLQAYPNAFGFWFGLNDFTLGALLKKLDDILERTINIITEFNGKNSQYCPMCGEEFDEESRVYNINNCKIKLHAACGGEVKAAYDAEHKVYTAAPNNYFKGFWGVVIGAVVGVVSYIIFFFMGFISAISSVISMLLGSTLYKKFGGKPNYVMIIMTSVITILSLVITLYLLYSLAAVGLAYEEGLTLSMGEAFTHMMKNSEFSAEFWSNMAMTVLFTLLGAGIEVYNLSKGVHKRTTVK